MNERKKNDCINGHGNSPHVPSKIKVQPNKLFAWVCVRVHVYNLHVCYYYYYDCLLSDVTICPLCFVLGYKWIKLSTTQI